MEKFTEAFRGFISKSDYEASYQEAEEILKRLSKKMKQHKNKFSKDEKNWGYVGDIERLVSILREADEAI
jgi:hypothetical protein